MFRRWQRRRPKVSQGLRSHSTPVVLCTVKRWTLSSFSRWPPIIASHSQRLFWRVNAAHYWQATAKKQKRGETREIEAWRMSNWLKGVPSSCKIANRCAINAPRFFLDPFPDRISVARSCPAMVLFFFSHTFFAYSWPTFTCQGWWAQRETRSRVVVHRLYLFYCQSSLPLIVLCCVFAFVYRIYIRTGGRQSDVPSVTVRQPNGTEDQGEDASHDNLSAPSSPRGVCRLGKSIRKYKQQWKHVSRHLGNGVYDFLSFCLLLFSVFSAIGYSFYLLSVLFLFYLEWMCQ